MDATPEEDHDVGREDDDLDDIVIDLPPPPSLTALAQVDSAEAAAANAPPPRSGALKRCHDSAPALGMTTSPALGLNKRWGRDTLVVTHAEVELSQGNSAENLAYRGWGEDSPPSRLSRSLSSSQATAPAAWIGAGGCSKVSRSSLRRRSRANSTSSPLPVLETSASMPTGGTATGLSDAAAGGDWTSRSFGSAAAFPRHGRRRSHCGGGGGAGGSGGNGEHHRSKSSCEVPPGLHGSAPLARSYRMPFWNNQGGGSGGNSLQGGGNSLNSGGRPISLPSGITRKLSSGARLLAEEPEPPCTDDGADSGFGWVLRSPGAPLDDRRRSQSFAGGGVRLSLERSKSESNPPGSSFSTGGARRRPPGLVGASGDEYGLSDAWMGRGLDGQDLGMGGDGDEDMAPAQTPQGSELGTSAALYRAHGLSSVARRMDRLEIRSPNVESHAAQVCVTIPFFKF